MSKNICRDRLIRRTMEVLTSLSVSFIIFFTGTFTAYAEDIPTDSDTGSESEYFVRIPDFPTEVSSIISHSHRGDSSYDGGCYTTPVLHKHSGSTEEEGKCFVPVYHSHAGSCYTSKTCTVSATSWDICDYKSINCPVHGETTAVTYRVVLEHHGCGKGGMIETQGGNCIGCGNSIHASNHSYQVLTCTKGTNYIEGYKKICDMIEDESIDHYDLSCGLEETEYGTLRLTNTTPEWTNGNVHLAGELIDPSGVIGRDGYGELSFDCLSGNISGREGNEISVSENGTYRLSASVNSDLFDTAFAEVILNVSNIDTTPPVITDVSYDDSETWALSNTITVTAVDTQPDQTPGSDIAVNGYSFDGGMTWQSDNSYECTENKTVNIKVRDYCGNESETAVTISNIDREGPVVEYNANPGEWYDKDAPRIFSFTASDNKSGLAEAPFSFDSGDSWTNLGVTTRSYPGSFILIAKDNLGNQTSVTVTNEYNHKKSDDDDGPTDPGGGDDPENNDPVKKPKKESPSDNDDENDDTEEDNNYSYDTNDDDSDTGDDIPSDESDLFSADGKAETVYFEQVPTASYSDAASDNGNVTHLHFYETKGFKVVACTGGGLLGLLFLLLLLALLYSGVRIYSYDGVRYRLLGILPVRRTSHGYTVNLSDKLIDRSYSSKYKLVMGRIFIKKHQNELIYVHHGDIWVPIHIERSVIFSLANE